MKQTIVIISDSPLGLFMARLLDRDLAREAQNQVMLVTRHREITYLPQLRSVIGKKRFTLPADRLPHVRSHIAETKSIHLTRRQIITTKGVIDYDYLVLDQTPVFSVVDIEKIARETRRLITHLQAKQKTRQSARAMIRCNGESANSWQLALALRADLDRLLPHLAVPTQVTVDLPSNKKIQQFLTTNGLAQKTTGLVPGFSIGKATPPISNRKVHGLIIDNEGYALTDHSTRLTNHPDVIVIDHPYRLLQNLLRTDQTHAQQLVDNVTRLVNGEHPKALELPRPALLLATDRLRLSWLGSVVSQRIKARLIGNLENRLFRRLTSGE